MVLFYAKSCILEVLFSHTSPTRQVSSRLGVKSGSKDTARSTVSLAKFESLSGPRYNVDEGVTLELSVV